MGPFLKNTWYAAAWDHEVSVDSPLARRILNEPLVLFRDTAGKVVALEDRCCHRHLPLSQRCNPRRCPAMRLSRPRIRRERQLRSVPGQTRVPPGSE